MRKLTVFILALFLILTVSCASGNGSEEVFDEDFSSNETRFDLGGFCFEIRFYDDYTPEDGSVFGYKNGSEFNDAAVKRIEEVEKSMNCTITPSNSSGLGLESNFNIVQMSGLNFCSAVITSSYSLRPSIEAGLFEPLSQVSDIIDYRNSEKWGNWKVLEQSVWDGEIYGVVPVQWPEVEMSEGYLFVFNEKFAGLLGQPDPREYIEDRSWSREILGEMMLTYTTDDLGHNLKALMAYDGHFYDTALRANNAQAYKLVNGEYVSGYHTPEGLEALTWADDFLHVTYADCIYPDPGTEDGRNKVFINENCAMLYTRAANAFGSNDPIPYAVENICILPMPNGPERVNQPYTTFFECVHDNILFPTNGNIEYSAVIVNALFEPLEGFGADELKDYYMRYLCHSETDYNVAKELFANGRYSFVSDGIRAPLVEALYGNHSKTVAQVFEATEEVQNELVQKYLVPTVSSLEEIFGTDALE